jgi:hypothetical protein
MTPAQLKKKMERMRKYFNKAEDLLNTIPNGLQEELADYHNECYSLQHCIRWGLQASEELRDNAKKVIRIANENGSNNE